ncbi:Peptide methionine sulfoxide reductase [Tetrabaena socialis]|uniref:peptide-methionine (S)-S-oxide reductase n=1 Tax=Tetrabaena socialis TaxID=47790 RepID=A0A2J8AEJ1_9CHLO|nr:Peptide methionine sulfoxide reductase [Tetrabaena socialis]|eukprot:PNH10940.1 Peptide methionine sulfoxide reductase [Tetrabaena socialis]
MAALVTSIDKETIKLDLNHELAGKALTFDVELMKLVPSERMARATFGAGCFWGPELAFMRVPGVLSTEVGYTNGETENPSYEEVCSGTTGHAEVVQVVYDPEEVSYERLLEEFWARHNPTQLNRQGNDVGTQYRSGIFTHTPAQLEAAMKSKAAQQGKSKEPVVTVVEELANYTSAEPYHQQYLAKGGRGGRPQDPRKGCTDPIRCYG